MLDRSEKERDGRLRESRSAPRGDVEARADADRRFLGRAQSYADDLAREVRDQMKSGLERKGLPSEAPPAGPQAGGSFGGRVAPPQRSAEAVAVDRVWGSVPKLPPLVVREYAAPRPGSGDRAADAGDTVLWQPVVVLPADGKARLNFHLGSAPGGYEVVVAGHTLDGRVGAVRGLIPVARPAPPAPAAP